MGDISPHFSKHEVECKGVNCCSHTTVIRPELFHALERLRTLIKQPLAINSGFRCLTHNREIGSKDTSQHVQARAVDIALVEGMTSKDMSIIAGRILGFEDGGIGLYNWGIHVDIRTDGPSRWDKRASE